MKPTERIAAMQNMIYLHSLYCLGSQSQLDEVVAMVSPQPEETLHNYLRKYFEKVSRKRARKLAGERLAKEIARSVHAQQSQHVTT